MRNKKLDKMIIIALTAILILGGSGGVYAFWGNWFGTDNASESAPLVMVHEQTKEEKKAEKEAEKQEKEQEKEIKKEVKEELKNKIKEKKNQKAVEKFEKFAAELNFPDHYSDKFMELLDKGYDPKEMMIAYDFLSENLGSIDELESLLESKKNKKWSEIFDAYLKAIPEFNQTDFDAKYLDGILKAGAVTTEDIAFADALAQRTNSDAVEIINQKRDGKSWEEIAVEKRSANTKGKLAKISVTEKELQETMQKNNVDEKQAIKILKKEKKALKHNINKDKSEAEIEQEILEEKYK